MGRFLLLSRINSPPFWANDPVFNLSLVLAPSFSCYICPMKIAVICNDRMALPALQYLTEEKMLVGIATPEHNTELLEQLGMIALKKLRPHPYHQKEDKK